jgi:hypothetical protein
MRTPDRKPAESPARMRTCRATHSLSYPIRLPAVAQFEALCLLDASRKFSMLPWRPCGSRWTTSGVRETKYAYKQVTALIEQSCNFYLSCASLPDPVIERLQAGATLAPTSREMPSRMDCAMPSSR